MSEVLKKLKAFWLAFIAWFGPVAGAIAGEINSVELLRVLMLMFGSGGVAQAVQILLSQGGGVIIDPTARGFVTAGVAAAIGLIEYYRRKAQGAKLPKAGA